MISFDVFYVTFSGQRQHRRLVDCSRRRSPHAAALPAEAASHLEELQAQDLQRRTGARQLHPDEEGPQDIPLPAQVLDLHILRV